MSVKLRFLAKVLISLVIFLAGMAKLSGNPMMLESFSDLNLPLWISQIVGIIEIACAIGIWVPAVARLSAAIVCCLMIGAFYYHARYTTWQNCLLPLAIFCASLNLVLHQRRVISGGYTH